MSSADNHGQRFMKGRGSYARPALEIAEAFPLLSARLSAIARRFAAIVAVLVMAGAFVSGAASGSAPTATAVATNFPVHAEVVPSDPFFVDQWGLQSIGAPTAWNVNLGSHSVLVAVVDTGVWGTEPDIQANMWTNTADGTHGWDFVDGDSNPMDIDPSGTYHGTGVAGVIAAITDNGQGIAGTAQISVIALRALGSNGQGSSLNTSQAIRWAADQGAKVINLSLGTNETFVGPTDIQLAVNYAWSKGALIVAAAGNSGTSTLDYPARLANVVSVAAIDESGTRASFSNYGSGLAVTDTHVLWGTVSGSLGNATAVQSGQTHDSFTANGFSMPSGAGAMYFKVVATVNGTTYTSREYTVTASSLPDFLFVLYQLLASNLLYLALFILVLAGVVAFIPQRRAARARRAAARPLTLYPPSYYVQAARPSQPPPVPQPTQVAPWIEPQMAGPPAAPTQIASAAQPVAPIPMAQPTTVKKRCPSCGTMVAADNMFCFFCGNRFR